MKRKAFAMKSYEEMIQNILDARDEYDQKKQRQRVITRRYIPIVSSFCFAILIGFSVWNRMEQIPALPPDTASELPMTTIAEPSESTTAATEDIPIPTETDTIQISLCPFCEHGNNLETFETPSESSIMAESFTELPETTEEITYLEIPETSSLEIVEPTEEIPEPEPFQAITEPIPTEPEPITELIQATTQPLITEPTMPETTENPSDEPETTEIPDEETSTNPETSLSWEDMTINQRYNMAEFGEPVQWYVNADQTIPAEKTGELLGSAYMDGYDSDSDTYYHCNTAVYAVQGFSEWEVIAVRFEEYPDFFIYLSISLDENRQKEILSALA